MSDSHEIERYKQQLPADDGWGDAAVEASERTIKGTLLKFADWHWSAGREATPVEDGTQLVALATSAAWVKWEKGKPVRYIVRESGRRLPERDELGDTDVNKWEAGPDGDPKDPWQNTRFVYLVCPKSAEAFTFSTSSWGGRGAVSDLGDQISRMRSVHQNAVPLVELRAGPMPTKHGRKSKPIFKVIGWKSADGGDEQAPVERQISAKQADEEIYHHEMDDEIPF
jgi:hypothetical protein